MWREKWVGIKGPPQSGGTGDRAAAVEIIFVIGN